LLSTGGMAINSIVSFITAYRITFAMSFSVRIKLSQVMVKLFLPNYTYLNLKFQLDNLQRQII
jgi:hypothetical protein